MLQKLKKSPDSRDTGSPACFAWGTAAWRSSGCGVPARVTQGTALKCSAHGLGPSGASRSTGFRRQTLGRPPSTGVRARRAGHLWGQGGVTGWSLGLVPNSGQRHFQGLRRHFWCHGCTAQTPERPRGARRSEAGPPVWRRRLTPAAALGAPVGVGPECWEGTVCVDAVSKPP